MKHRKTRSSRIHFGFGESVDNGLESVMFSTEMDVFGDSNTVYTRMCFLHYFIYHLINVVLFC